VAEVQGGVGRDPQACARTRRFTQKVSGTQFYAESVADTEPTDAVRVPRYTASQRGALSPLAGWHVYDTDANKPLWYDGTNWRDGAGTIVP
jgi:hypothetical protein